MAGYQGQLLPRGRRTPDERVIELHRAEVQRRRNTSARQAVRLDGGAWVRPEWAADMDDHHGDDS